MSWELSFNMLQVAINGVISGLVIALLATAFSLVYVPTRVFHVALGGIVAFIPYVALQCQKGAMPVVVQVIAGLAAAMLLSVGCELLNHAGLERKKASSATHMVASLGAYIVIVQVIALAWGSDTQNLLKGLDEVIRFPGDVSLTWTQCVTAVVSILLLGSFHVWLTRTELGLRFRALADNPTELALRGYNTNRLRILAFAMSGAFAGVGAMLIAYDVGFDPHLGLSQALLAAVAVILGGRSSFVGPILGGLFLGILRTHVVWFLSARWQDMATFMVLAAFLFFRPHGMLGQRVRLEAEA